jgi:hypothetical protein
LPNHADCAQIEQPPIFPNQPLLKRSGQRAIREHSHPLSKGGKIPFPAEPRQYHTRRNDIAYKSHREKRLSIAKAIKI